MGKPKQPAAPDPVKTAQAQTTSNRETAITQTGLNAMDQVGPQGSVRYSQNGTWADGTPRFTQTTSLSPGQQAIYDTNQKTSANLSNTALTQSGRLDSLLAEPFSLDNDAVEGRINELANKRLDPQLAQAREGEIARLASQGIKLGSTAYDRAMGNFDQRENDARNQLLLNGRSQAVNEAITARQAPINEILALASGTQIQAPNYSATPQTGVAGTDVSGIVGNAHNANMAAYGQQMGQWNSTMGGLFGLGSSLLQAGGAAGGLGALFAMSDRRLKTDIEDTGEKVAGVPVKSFRWKGDGRPDVGVIAQDVEKKHPQLVRKTEGGVRAVNYGGLMKLGRKLDRAA